MTEWGGGSSFREVAEVKLQWNWMEKSGSGSCCNWKKIEDEIALGFKSLGYPFNISKTALVAAGSSHTWPTLLLALTWLIELLESDAQHIY